MNNQPITLISELGKGGEATIYHIAEHKELVAKIYHNPTPQREAKLRAMLLNPPEQPKTHIAIAWPTALLYQQKAKFYAWSALNELEHTLPEKFVGFLMPKISGGRAIFHLYNPVMRAKLPYLFDWRALHRTAYNLCVVVEAIHAKGYVIGDINESNILVNREALVTIVDCDSFQVKDEQGVVHHCTVGKPEYTPPELVGVPLSTVIQTERHDLFGLAVLLFQLLMEGYHPFAGVLRSKESVGRIDLFAIREGLFPYTKNGTINPPPNAPPHHMLYPALQKAFQTCFMKGYHDESVRPTASTWRNRLKQAEATLTQCKNNPAHVYSRHVEGCIWCERNPISLQKRASPNQQTTLNIQQHITQAGRAYKFEDTETVISVLTPLIDTGMAPAKAYEYRAWGYFKTRAYEQVIQDGLDAITKGSTNPETHFILGVSYHHLKNDTTAINHLTKAINLNYEPLQEAHYYRVKTYEKLGRPQSLLKTEWERVLELHENSYWGKQAKDALQMFEVTTLSKPLTQHQPVVQKNNVAYELFGMIVAVILFEHIPEFSLLFVFVYIFLGFIKNKLNN